MSSLSNRLLANKRFEFASSAFDADKFAVVNVEGYESLSRTFRFALTLVTDDADVDFDTMLRYPATFTLYAPDGKHSVPYHGVLSGFEQLHRSDGYVFYRAVLVPRLWRLSLSRISEVYLNEQTIPAIIEGVLKGARLPASAFELKLTGSYRPRSFVCQYQETHLDFLSRWMEKEGMYYWFEHEGGSDKLVIGDHRRMHAAEAIKVNYRPADELDTGAAPDAVQAFVCRQKPLPFQVILQDFNHRKANVELKVADVVSEHGFGDVMIYGENFRSEEEGKRYARLRAEEIACGGKVFSGDATAVGLRSGYFMELAHHYREDFNGKYLVTEVRHEGSQAGALLEGIRSPFSGQGAGGETHYRSSFAAIPADVQFRAERATAKPRVAGTMNATIDGEGSGEYAELDEYGQYKVQLPFDQSDKRANKGSARVRMATPYAGSNHGMHFPLHKNAEVLLSFTDGDPDQPVILGAVPNSENASLINATSATENRISTKGGNQMHMSDVKGKEVIWLNSPFHHSSIGIGSVDPRGGGSIFSATKGSSDSVSFGNSNSMSFGSKNSLSVGTSNSLDLSLSNKVSIGASVSVGLSNDIKWNMDLTPWSALDVVKKGDESKNSYTKSFTIDDSSNVKFASKKSNEMALEEYSISAGHTDADPLLKTLKFKKYRLRAAVAAYTAFNLTQSTLYGMYVNGQLKSPGEDTDIDTRLAASKAKRDAEKAKELAEIKSQYDAFEPSDADGKEVVRKYTAAMNGTNAVALHEKVSTINKKYQNKAALDDDQAQYEKEIADNRKRYPHATDQQPDAARDAREKEIKERYKAKVTEKRRKEIAAAYQLAQAQHLSSLDRQLMAEELEAAKNKQIDAVNKKYSAEEAEAKSGMTDRNFTGGWPGVISKFGVDAIFNVGAMALIQGYANKVAQSMKSVDEALISKISLDKKGINMTVNFPEADPLGMGGKNNLTINSDGVEVKTKNPKDGKYTALQLHSSRGGRMEVDIDKVVSVSTTESVLRYLEQKVTFNETSATMQAGPNTVFSATSSEASMKTAGASVKLTSADATMGTQSVSVKVSNTGIDLNSTGGTAQLGPTGVTLNGAMIQLG
ncbi:UNVERIFIED_ORG: Rhs element Vgr protein [Herbaspirillum seropedicae]|jgi:type VI secretion system Vgr family protein